MGRRPKYDWSNLEEDYKRLGSRKAVADLYGSSACAVRSACKRLGIPLYTDPMKRYGNYKRGREAELFVLDVLQGSSDYDTEVPIPTRTLMWNGKKVKVRSSELLEVNGYECWMFRVHKKRLDSVDYIACVGYENGAESFVLLVPTSEVRGANVAVYKKNYNTSRYKKFEIWNAEDSLLGV